MIISHTPLTNLLKVTSSYIADERGSFYRIFNAEELSKVMDQRRVAQVNLSKTNLKGTLRGLHYQRSPFAEMKIVRCIKGSIWDVAVDLRRNSPTFLQWHAEILSVANQSMLIIPEGFAHGFQALEDEVEILYLHTAPYSPNHEGGIMYDDPYLNISWPLSITEISKRDQYKNQKIEDFLKQNELPSL